MGMTGKKRGARAVLAAIALAFVGSVSASAQPASAQWPGRYTSNFDSAYAEIEAVFGGPAAMQAAYESAQAQLARAEGALQIGQNMEARFRASGEVQSADAHKRANDALRTSIQNSRESLAKLDALDTRLDEAKGKAAYNAAAAELALVLKKPLWEQYDYSKANPLQAEPLSAVVTAAALLAGVAKKPQP
jgi:hypothetical protein